MYQFQIKNWDLIAGIKFKFKNESNKVRHQEPKDMNKLNADHQFYLFKEVLCSVSVDTYFEEYY